MRHVTIAFVAVLLTFPSLAALAPAPPVGPALASPSMLAIVRAAEPAALETAGADVLYRFETVDAVVVAAPEAVLARLEAAGLAVERDAPVTLDLQTATRASRARHVWDASLAAPALLDGTGAPIDGRGIGVAVVDTGFDSTHPALPLASHRLITPTGMQEARQTAFDSAHGTHVAGIVAARAEPHVGAAPGAAVHAFAFGPRAGVTMPAIAFDWILAHHDEVDPPIRVVTNSWHCASGGCNRADTQALHRDLAERLAQAGVVVVFAAGNEAGRGIEPRTSIESTLDEPGILGVAANSDIDLGVRTQCASSYSSRGQADAPTTWPDVMAPGDTVMSTWPVYAGQDTRDPTGKNAYRQLSGTSMAAPHVAGIVALMLQANPDLTPAEVEYILKATATKPACGLGWVRADPAHPYDGANYAEGHGLVDAYAAVVAARSFTGIPPAPGVEPVPDAFRPPVHAVRVERTFYLAGDGDLRESARPDAQTPRTRVVLPRTPVSFTTPPFAEAATFEGLEALVHLGVPGEPMSLPPVTKWTVKLTFSRVTASGVEVPLATSSPIVSFTWPVLPRPRDFAATFPDGVTFAAGERARLTVLYDADGPGLLAWEGDGVAGYLGLGSLVTPPAPNSAEACQARGVACQRIDADRRLGTPPCEENTVMRVRWEGAGGSSALVTCPGVVASCSIPSDVAWGVCEDVSLTAVRVETTGGAACTFTTPQGSRVGNGWCEQWHKLPKDQIIR